MRAFDHGGFIITASVIDGSRTAASLENMFEDERVAEIHVHNASMGCYLARASRA
ncbi:MAG: DUF1203 domain-containing protein [Xanthomonadales bacterium]|nr:DUF1203 domain-containing protein [Xanthomonadales bacterium]NNL94012.1 DUF1203 domain-containing protein [Xanthomonadales bacterium]